MFLSRLKSGSISRSLKIFVTPASLRVEMRSNFEPELNFGMVSITFIVSNLSIEKILLIISVSETMSFTLFPSAGRTNLIEYPSSKCLLYTVKSLSSKIPPFESVPCIN